MKLTANQLVEFKAQWKFFLGTEPEEGNWTGLFYNVNEKLDNFCISWTDSNKQYIDIGTNYGNHMNVLGTIKADETSLLRIVEKICDNTLEDYFDF